MMRMTDKRHDPTCRAWAWLSLLALSGTLACSESPSDTASTKSEGGPSLDGATDAGVDAPIDRLADVAEDAGPDVGKGDAGGGGSGGGPTTVCEALMDGSCSPGQDPSVPECNGCYGYPGGRYDLDAKCVHPAVPETLICTTVCTCFTVQQCYVRETDGSVEVLLLGCHFESDQFEQETGLTLCDAALNLEVGNAPMCD